MEKFYAVIGDPIAHSLSPQMHNEQFQHFGINAHYLPLHITTENLSVAIKGLKAVGISGFNVTLPHKVAIMELLDEIDPLASSIGAVNTVVHLNGKYIGYNTDGVGFLEGLLSLNIPLKNKKILIIGAGGAARAIYYTLASEGYTNIDITNRTVEKAKVLIEQCQYQTNSQSLSLQEASEQLGNYSCVIQTTCIGMKDTMNEMPLSLKNLKKNTVCCDIIYNPKKTKFLIEAQKSGAIIQNGLEMFVNQGAIAFEKWTQIKANREMMKQTVQSIIGG